MKLIGSIENRAIGDRANTMSVSWRKNGATTPNKMAVMLLNSISNESKLKKKLVEKFWDEHDSG